MKGMIELKLEKEAVIEILEQHFKGTILDRKIKDIGKESYINEFTVTFEDDIPKADIALEDEL